MIPTEHLETYLWICFYGFWVYVSLAAFVALVTIFKILRWVYKKWKS